ncbi:MAG: glycosyltransferase [Rhodocyclaceae bacterium]|nr:glycosyltransferase [Rhodocyclaceae bacterium]
MAATVSVLLPSFNHERYLQAAIDSVLAQSLGELELIIIDDASSDESWNLIEAIEDPRVRAVRHATNAGAHATLNEALSLAQGEFVAILNSDDSYAPTRLERMVDCLRKVEAGFGFSDLQFIDADGTPCPDHQRATEHAELGTWCEARPATDWFLAGNLAITTSNFVFRRELASAIGGFQALRYTHDWAFALEAASRSAVCRVAEPLLSYRVHPSNTLSEADGWRHIHENGFIQGLALRRLTAIQAQQGDERPLDEVFCALLRNRSGPPAVTLAHFVKFANGADDASLLDMALPTEGGWWAERMQACSGLGASSFLSCGEIDGLRHQIAAQGTMLEERWKAMEAMRFTIDERDTAIMAQKELIEERWRWVKALEQDLAQRDQTIRDQTDLIDARDRTIASQGEMLENRYATMQAMGEEIHEKATTIQDLEARLTRILSHPAIRVARKLKRMFGGGA